MRQQKREALEEERVMENHVRALKDHGATVVQRKKPCCVKSGPARRWMPLLRGSARLLEANRWQI